MIVSDTGADTRTVHVDLGARSYDILVGGGLVARAGQEIAARLPGIRAAIVTDANVAPLHLDLSLIHI